MNSESELWWIFHDCDLSYAAFLRKRRLNHDRTIPGSYPIGSLSSWDVRDDLSFVHLYCTDKHLRQLAEQVWDRSPQSIQVDEYIFVEDPQITLLYRQFLLNCRWQELANHVALSSTATLLMAHLLKSNTQLQWTLPVIRGGLAQRY